MRVQFRSLLAAAVLLVLPAFNQPALAQGPGDSGGLASYDHDAALVHRTVARINAQLHPAFRATDRVAAHEWRAIIVLAMTGASNAEILAYNAETGHRLDAAVRRHVDTAHIAADGARAAFYRWYGFVPDPYGETLGVAILAFDSNVATHLRTRWGQINDLVAWLTR